MISLVVIRNRRKVGIRIQSSFSWLSESAFLMKVVACVFTRMELQGMRPPHNILLVHCLGWLNLTSMGNAWMRPRLTVANSGSDPSTSASN